MLNRLLDSSRSTKRLISFSYDLFAIPLAIYMALALRYGSISPLVKDEAALAIGFTTIATLALFIRLGLYRAVIRFMTGRTFWALIMGIVLSSLCLATSSYLLKSGIPRSSIIIYIFTAYTLLGIPRLFIRSLVTQLRKSNAEPVLIYGAGSHGFALANALLPSELYRPVGFVDDSRRKHHATIHGMKVWPVSEIDDICEVYGVGKVLLALGKSSMYKRKQLIEELAGRKLEVLITPPFSDIISGKAKIEEVREVDIEDLLGREAIHPHHDLMSKNITNKNVLVTGAGGSIGSEIARQALIQNPSSLILLDISEYNLYGIEQELQRLRASLKVSTNIVTILASVQDQPSLHTAFKKFSINTIYHAAAYKHVPLVENNIIEGVKNNVFGTWHCSEAAILAGVSDFVLISTDKAVRPTNIMGASKRLAELVLQALSDRQSDTKFSMVRFGNVLGSSGSVVPLFREQIRRGGPITVTHPDIIRYFMTIPEASQLVIQASSMAKGGDVFVLDMGEPIKITSLAKKMIHLSGLSEISNDNPNGDIEIHYTGLRPGEKLYEELLIGEKVQGTSHPRIMTATEIALSWPETHNLLGKFKKACYELNTQKVITLIKSAPIGYQESGQSIEDWPDNTPSAEPK